MEPEATPALRIALAGNPNVGKTTVFNLLTGLRQKVANYPGVTVERKSGLLSGHDSAEVIDLPGTYSLSPKSEDERIAYNMLTGRLERAPDVVVCVVDAGNLERNLYLATQITDLGLPLVIALNMVDSAQQAGLTIDTDTLAVELGVPVIATVASRGEGIDALRKAALSRPPVPEARRWPMVDAMSQCVASLSELLPSDMPATHRFMEVLRALADEAAPNLPESRTTEFQRAVERAREALAEGGIDWRHAEIMGRYNFLARVAARAVTRVKEPSERTLTDQIDAVVTHRVAGPLLFFLLLGLVFQAVFAWAVPVMDLIEASVTGLGRLVRNVLPASVATDLLVEGVIAGVGNVVVFLPQILLLFFFLGLMEDTGYMARSAFIMDRVMRKVGLSGGSVLPLLSSFACAIPGIMAARTLDNERDRLITIMVAPLMSCSARLPIYTLFIAAFIPSGVFFGIVGWQGLAMFTMYLMGTVMAFVAAWILKRFVFKGTRSHFVMELPPYRVPKLRQVAWRMVERSKVFAVRAGRIIFTLSIVLWVLANYPSSPEEPTAERLAALSDYRASTAAIAATFGLPIDSLRFGGPEVQRAVEAVESIYEAQLSDIEDAWQSRRIRDSFIGMLGRFLEPVMQPLGFDWKMSAGIVTAFAAREVIISTLGIIYSVEDADETSEALRDRLKADTYDDGRTVYTPLVAISLLVFFVFALQCMSTLAIARRETNTWLWPAVMWIYMTGLAWIFSFVVYQGGLALGYT